MYGILYLAWKYLTYYRVRSCWLIGSVTLTLLLPIASRLIVNRFQDELQTRAASTPLVIGAKGSRFELAIHALHFTGNPPKSIPYSNVVQLQQSKLAQIVPIHARFRTRGFASRREGYAIVGTSLDYFDFRNLSLAQGENFLTLGECVVGSEIARREDLKVGDTLMSQTQNAYDMVASPPLKMKIVGILAPSHGDDDTSVFVDLKTAWVIEGLGHGHQDLENVEDQGMVMGRDGDEVVASPAVTGYLEITPENIDSFHFHGEIEDFPVTAVIAIPDGHRNQTILEGRFVDEEQPLQVIYPRIVMDELLQRVFRARRFFDIAIVIVFIVTTCFVILVTMMSRQLRQREMSTMFKIGCGPYMMLWMQLVELCSIFLVSAVLACLSAVLIASLASPLIRQLVF